MFGLHISLDRPGRRSWQLPLQAAAGAALGVLLAFGGGYLGPLLVRGIENGWNDLVASLLGALGGYIAGAALGVVVSARLMKLRGTGLYALLGGFAGAVAVILLAEPLRLNQHSALLMTVYAAATLIGALGGYRLRFRK